MRMQFFIKEKIDFVITMSCMHENESESESESEENCIQTEQQHETSNELEEVENERSEDTAFTTSQAAKDYLETTDEDEIEEPEIIQEETTAEKPTTDNAEEKQIKEACECKSKVQKKRKLFSELQHHEKPSSSSSGSNPRPSKSIPVTRSSKSLSSPVGVKSIDLQQKELQCKQLPSVFVATEEAVIDANKNLIKNIGNQILRDIKDYMESDPNLSRDNAEKKVVLELTNYNKITSCLRRAIANEKLKIGKKSNTVTRAHSRLFLDKYKPQWKETLQQIKVSDEIVDSFMERLDDEIVKRVNKEMKEATRCKLEKRNSNTLPVAPLLVPVVPVPISAAVQASSGPSIQVKLPVVEEQVEHGNEYEPSLFAENQTSFSDNTETRNEIIVRSNDDYTINEKRRANSNSVRSVKTASAVEILPSTLSKTKNAAGPSFSMPKFETSKRPRRNIVHPKKYSSTEYEIMAPISCTCKVKWTPSLINRQMVECSGPCRDWYHFKQNGIGLAHCDYVQTPENDTADWFCERCRTSNNEPMQTDEIKGDEMNEGVIKALFTNSQTPDINVVEDLVVNNDEELAEEDEADFLSFFPPTWGELFVEDSILGFSTSFKNQSSSLEAQKELSSVKKVDLDYARNTASEQSNILKPGTNPLEVGEGEDKHQNDCQTESEVFKLHENSPVSSTLQHDTVSSELEESDTSLDLEEINLDRNTICEVLEIEKKDLDYVPPLDFTITFSAEEINKMFDFTKNTFINKRGAIISKKITEIQKCCSFNCRRKEYYYSNPNRGFCTMDGRCGCKMGFTFKFDTQPIMGQPLTANVTTKGAFVLIQKNNTGRQIRGDLRKELGLRLKSSNSTRVFLDNFEHVDGLRLLHKNLQYASEGALRKIKAEAIRVKRIVKSDVLVDMIELQKELERSHHPNSVVKGYIQDLNPNPANFRLHLYDFPSLKILGDKLKREIVTISLDATGGIINQLNRPSCNSEKEKKRSNILIYTLVAESKSGSFVAGEMVSQQHKVENIKHFINCFTNDLKRTNPRLVKTGADIICVDFNIGQLHASTEGFCKMEMKDYFKLTYKCLSDGTPFPKNKPCVVLCTSHYIKTVERNLSRKLGKTKAERNIKTIALKSAARIQECTSLVEFSKITEDMSYVFGKKCVDLNKQQEAITRLSGTELDDQIGFDLNDRVLKYLAEIGDVNENGEDFKLLRENSSFYHSFKQIRSTVCDDEQDDKEATYGSLSNEEGAVSGEEINVYYKPEVLDMYEKTYAPIFPYISRAIQKLTKDKYFTRQTTGCVESKFRYYKHNLFPVKVCANDFIRERQECLKAEQKKFVVKAITRLSESKSVGKSSKGLEFESQIASETWQKGTRKVRKSKHFTPRENLVARDKIRDKSERDIEYEADQDNESSCTVKIIPHKLKTPGNVESERRENTETSADDLEINNQDHIEEQSCNWSEEENSSVEYRIPHFITQEDGTDDYIHPETSVFARTGPYTVTKSEFHYFFHSTKCISDDVINCYMEILKESHIVNEKKIHIAHTSWLALNDAVKTNASGDIGGDIPMGWQKLPEVVTNNITDKDTYILHPLRIEGNHWVLTMTDLEKGKIRLMDSLQENLSSSVEENIRREMSSLCRSINPNILEWDIEKINVPQQFNNSSCGIYVLLFSSQLLHAFPEPTVFKIAGSDDQIRMDIACQMMNTSVGCGYKKFYASDPDKFIRYLESPLAAALEEGWRNGNKI